MGEECYQMFTSPGSHFSQRGRACYNRKRYKTMAAHLYAPNDQKQHSVTRTQITDIWRTGTFLLTLALASCVMTCSKKHVHCHVTEVGQVAANAIRGETDQT